MFAIRPSRQEMYADDPKFLWKYILRSLSVILAIISIGLIGWSLANQVFVINDIYTDFGYAYYDSLYNNDFWFLPWEIISLGLSVIWNLTNILVLLTRNRPIHPGANVACDLLLWLALMATGTLATLGAETYFWWYPTNYDSYNDITGPYDTSSSSSSSSSNSAVNQTGVVVALVGTAIGFIVLLMHFALFVSACRYTNARRRARRVDGEAALIAQRMFDEKVGRDVAAAKERNPNAGFVPISEPVEQQAPLDYGMPPAPTGMTVGDQGKRRAGMGEEVEGRGRGSRYSYEQPEVVGGGGEGPGDGRAGVPVYGDDVYEA